MPFGDPIVAGTTLVRSSIHSPGYTPGVTGWSINADGTAEFAGGAFRGPVQVLDPNTGDVLGSVDELGNFTGPNAYLSNDVILDGTSLAGMAANSPNIPRIRGGGEGGAGGGIIDSLPYGLISSGGFLSTNGRVIAPGVTWGLCSTSFYAEPGRMYRVCVRHVKIVGTVTGGYDTIALRANFPAYDGDETATSPPVAGGTFLGYIRLAHMNATYDLNGDMGPYACGSGLDIPHPGIVQLVIDLSAATQTITIQQTQNTVPYVARCDIYDVGPTIFNSASFLDQGTGGIVTPVRNYSKSYVSTDSGTYTQGGAYISSFGNEMLQGYNQGTGGSNGTMRAMATFPSMTGDFAGAAMTGMSVRVHDHHWWRNAGGTAVIGLHGSASLPGTFGENANSVIVSTGFPVGATRTIQIPSAYWAGFQAGTYKGITLNPPNSGDIYYGRFDGAGYGYPPVIYASYAK